MTYSLLFMQLHNQNVALYSYFANLKIAIWGVANQSNANHNDTQLTKVAYETY